MFVLQSLPCRSCSCASAAAATAAATAAASAAAAAGGLPEQPTFFQYVNAGVSTQPPLQQQQLQPRLQQQQLLLPLLGLPFAAAARRLLRHRVSQSAAEAAAADNPALYRHWPHLLLYAPPLPAGAAASSSSSSSSSRRDQPPEVLAAAEEQLLLRGSWAGRPLADTPAANLKPQNKNACKDLIHLLMLQEVKKLQKERTFRLPHFGPGDLVEVQYELSRSQQTVATFQGYVVSVRQRSLNSSVVLRNGVKGVAVEQRIPLFSPRLLSFKVLRSASSPSQAFVASPPPPPTRDYRYKWKYNVRGKYERRRGTHKPGVRTVEHRLRSRVSSLLHRYMRQRLAANLPPYVWGGPYPRLREKRTKEIRGELYRRMLVYSFDEQRRRQERLRKRRESHKFGVYKLRRQRATALEVLPPDHPLHPSKDPPLT
ncbi:ribosomal protein L19, putative [Eimeria tenella]|uniref:50S ribosomal protein L19, chloroplastic n=1 Tax=Eimeria tenella TaxID=5802 RepID=U6KG88_EIMTE|nr:ribosomal protein L19, putative [Eimeria tenella]CDJ36944.1 ribosomal protein L19, putative [Eimeria tenella]|eukprot:XP_013227782.1 ribosomal protein L19, putative [Eimeria tenella]